MTPILRRPSAWLLAFAALAAIALVAVMAGMASGAFQLFRSRAPTAMHNDAITNDAHESGAHDAGRTANPRPDTAPARGEVVIDPRRQQLIGVRTVIVERKPLAARLRTVGIVRHDETRLTDINLKVEAWIRSLAVDYTGQFVQKGQPLFTIYSPDLLATQQEYALALKSRAQLARAQVGDTREYADRLVDAARRRLALWDLSDDQIRALEEGRPAESVATFRSPVSGVVMEKRAVQGLHVMPGDSLYRLADLSTVWIEADVYERDMPFVRVGAPATVTLDAYPADRFRGRAIYVHPFVDEPSRTVKVRFALPNRDGRLKPGMYANVEITGESRTVLAVPGDAVLEAGADRVVFVAQGDGYFEPRHVTIGQRFGETIEIRDGLKEGEQVATGAAFFLDSESQLRASLQAYSATPAAPITPSRPSTPGTPGRPSAGGPPPHSPEPLRIAVRMQPDPPKAGEETFEVEVKTLDGEPITDAEVTVALFMAAMPTMNMPAMRNEAKLPAIAGGASRGVYRGPVTIMMSGRWDVTIVVSRAGRRLGTKQLSVVAQ